MRWYIAAEEANREFVAAAVSHLGRQFDAAVEYDWTAGPYDPERMVRAVKNCDIFVLLYHNKPKLSMDAFDAVMDRDTIPRVYVVGGGDDAARFTEDRPVRYVESIDDVFAECEVSVWHRAT